MTVDIMTNRRFAEGHFDQIFTAATLRLSLAEDQRFEVVSELISMLEMAVDARLGDGFRFDACEGTVTAEPGVALPDDLTEVFDTAERETLADVGAVAARLFAGICRPTVIVSGDDDIDTAPGERMIYIETLENTPDACRTASVSVRMDVVGRLVIEVWTDQPEIKVIAHPEQHAKKGS